MKQYIDLHTHSNYTGGKCTPAELCALAKKNDISVLALADHNVIDGISELRQAGNKYGVHIINGVEIYTRYRNQNLHLLGYNFELGDNKLTQTLNILQKDNIRNVKRSIHSLQEQGFTIDEEALFKSPAKNRGVLHVLQEIERHPKNLKKMEKELPDDKRDFFGKIKFYMGYDTPAALRLSEVPTDEAITIVQQSGGFAILAHPGQQLNYEGDKLILELVKAGLEGIEILSPYHSWHQIEHYQTFAIKNKLLATGGSDFHGDIDFTKRESITRQWDYFKIPYTIYENLKKRFPGL